MISEKNIRVKGLISRKDNEKLKERADKLGKSVSEHIGDLIRADIKKHG